jgi:hypothetical protein
MLQLINLGAPEESEWPSQRAARSTLCHTCTLNLERVEGAHTLHFGYKAHANRLHAPPDSSLSQCCCL